MNAIMAKIGKSLASAVLGTARNAISTSPYLSTTENAFGHILACPFIP